MKRSPELTPLSHEHHQALVVAMNLKRADTLAEGQRLLEFHRSEGEHHFEIEERILLPFWIAIDGKADRDAANRVLSEHLELRAAVHRIEVGEVSIEDLRRIGGLLETHVRYEERELFPTIEAALSNQALADLGAAIAAADAA
ncbi:MAG: hemerythrin domain-containing protein [Solirubrobacterales bacterium]